MGIDAVHQPAGKQRAEGTSRLVDGRHDGRLADGKPDLLNQRWQPAAENIDEEQPHKVDQP